MTDVASWGWLQPTLYPGWTAASDDNLDSRLDGINVDISNFYEVTIRDADGDGIVSDTDADDGSNVAPGEGVIGPSGLTTVREVARYDDSEALAGGVTYTGLAAAVMLFDDGSWAVRLHDETLPPTLWPRQVASLRLGTWDGVEYSGAYTASFDEPLCFATETPLRTPHGWRRAGDLRLGDRVTLFEGDTARITWRASATLPARSRRHAPVVLPPGAFGARCRIRLSPLHGVLIRSSAATLLFGKQHVLVAARDLVGHRGTKIVPASRVTYVHLGVGRHAILQAPGLGCESYRGGHWAETLVRGATRSGMRETPRYPSCLPVLTRPEARVLMNYMRAGLTGAPSLSQRPYTDAS
ncbi:hypothetical protein ROJ8625_00439 [Roseivivax jejudonensis]|uniref:Hedgehog/Intein (Hint) domain-containing protein n=1 Tax=Roseivivax jejudonensis TaxID=1529041 RepID=A0A1X6Y8F0_9RHOB|nr:Hint domain-containing protein [Roseivivax jejudonensis]SLN13983.1 hypothetical protein ROJ8625_00439 [Roseivivax jejudonensis]